ncbi:protein-export chaperone SecB [Planctobacterium marinum]|uniref:protein-export chaperone SecB n=1 Tax=Planctobacterium marinum TaxID=1631968 RepID=UPI001E3F2AA0|nr:protein-export chaperone SecB [Planctobacterium marinum]MCC2607736.1 protein-export chaperone SecB [Planctobacterium marinum]
MNIQLYANKAVGFNLIRRDEIDEFEKLEEFGFDYKPVFDDECSFEFRVFFRIRLKVNETHLLLMEYESTFKLEEAVDNNFINSHFPHVNAPAIAFPYLRAFISTLLLNAGYEPIMLPSINFSALYKEKEAEILKD